MYSYHQHSQQAPPAPYQQYSSQPAYPPSSYPSSSYPPRYPPQHQYAPPPPPNPQQMPPAQFRPWFLGRLSELVVNQKNLIHNLAYIANDQANRIPDVIAECMETHIRRAHPQIKLPAWYLLDSIAKNIGPPYTPLFSKFVVPLFLDSYFAVDLPTRSKMEEMLITWRTGGRGGVELFGVDAQVAMEKGVGWDAGSSSSAGPSRHVNGPTRGQVLTELDVILAQKTRAVEINPYDEQSKGHVDTLLQLRNLVQNSSVSPPELAAIASQLRTLARTTASTAPPLPPMVPPPQAGFSSAAPQSSYPATASYQVPQMSAPRYDVPAVSAASFSPPVTAPVLPAVGDISALFNNLVKAGVVSSAAAPSTSVLPPMQSLQSLLNAASGLVKQSETSMPANPQLESEQDYERRIMSMPVSLTTASLQRENLTVVNLIYEHLPLQCKQCAQRFPNDGPASKKRYEDHLDLHFRQNLRNAQASTATGGVGTMGRGYTRSWFVSRMDWVNDAAASGSSDQSKTSDPKGKGRANSPMNAAEREAKLRATFVIMPPGDETKSIKCPICKERLVTEFLEDEEEWVWRNAVSIKGKIYHATCHADAIAANVARLRQEAAGKGRSRSATPDAVVLKSEDVKPGTSPLAGSKRKSRDEDEDSRSSHSRSPSASQPTDVIVKLEQTDSPRPHKKVALAPA